MSSRNHWFQGKLAVTSPTQSTLWFDLFSRLLINERKIPQACCNGATHRRQPCLGSFNLFLLGEEDTVSLPGSQALDTCDMCYFERARHQSAGNRKWSQDVFRGSIHWGEGRGTWLTFLARSVFHTLAAVDPDGHFQLVFTGSVIRALSLAVKAACTVRH